MDEWHEFQCCDCGATISAVVLPKHDPVYDTKKTYWCHNCPAVFEIIRAKQTKELSIVKKVDGKPKLSKVAKNPKSKVVAILMAVFALGFITWAYTYDVDKRKFWINLGIAFSTLGLSLWITWPVAVIMAINRSKEWYKYFPEEG